MVKIVMMMVLLCSSRTAFAYVDPGTGSMLFSILVCSVTTIFFLFKIISIKVKQSLFLKKDISSAKHKFVIYSEGNQYYAVFKPVLDEFEFRKIPVVYYTSAIDDFVFLENYVYVKTEYIGGGNKAYMKLAFLNADVCLMTTPQLDVLQLKRSKNVKHYAHILHSIGFSYSYRLFSLDYYDSVLCDAPYQIPMIRELEYKRGRPEKKLPVVGSTYMDFNKHKLQKIQFPKKQSQYTVLIAPTWGKDSLLNQYGEKIINQFVSTNYRVIIRPHPQSLIKDKAFFDKLMKQFAHCKNILWDMEKDNLKSMAEADILLTDWSSVMLDYALLFERTFLYTGTNISNEMFDSYELENPAKWKYDMISQIGRKLNQKDMDCLPTVIDDIRNSNGYKENIDKARKYFWAHQGESAKNVVDFLIDVQQSLSAVK